MKTNNWPILILEGKTHQIPRICPFLLEPGTEMMRARYQNGRTAYTQIFWYSKTGLEWVNAYRDYQRKRAFWFFSFLAALIALGAAIYFLNTFIGINTVMLVGLLILGGLVLLTIYLVIIDPFYVTGALRGKILKASPIPKAQLEAGQAVAVTGSKGWFKQSTVYKAARAEWLLELAKANPSLVEQKSYQILLKKAARHP